MEDYNKDMDDLFRAGLGNYTETPPARVWPALEKRLDDRRKRPAIGWFWPVILLSFSVLIAGVVAWKGNVISEQVNGTPHVLHAVNTPVNTITNNTTQAAIPLTLQTSSINNSLNNPYQSTKKTLLSTAKHFKNNATIHAVNGKIATMPKRILAEERMAQSASLIMPKAAAMLTTSSSTLMEPLLEKAATNPPNAAFASKSDVVSTTLNSSNNLVLEGPQTDILHESIVDKQIVAPSNKPKKDTSMPDQLKIHKPIILGTGIAAGYEMGMQANAANKALIAPYVSVPLSNKVSLKLQPAIGVSNIGNHTIGGTNSYYQRVSNSTTVNLHQEAVVNAFNPTDTLGLMVNYNYSQNHDSLAKSYSSGGTYFEAQLPILLQFSVTDKLSVYGGLNLVYSKYVPVSEHTYDSGPQTSTGSSPVVFVPKGETMPQAPPADSVIILKGTPISQYSGPAYTAISGARFSVGYMLGISYKLNNKWSADLLLQQSGVSTNMQGGVNINAPLATPYIRLMIGYKFKDLILKPKH
jgi:opacity protein-like surface antigen